MGTILSVRNLRKQFDEGNEKKTKVLNDISFDVEEADFIAIMGPSGSGKSTLLHNVSGLDQPSSGTIILEEKNITDLDQREMADIRLRKFGFVFQQPHLINTLTVRENIILASSVLNKQIDKSITDKANELMKLTGIIELADKDTMSLSGGQAQRVSICRSFMNNPKLVFADEPTGSLNSKSSEDIMNLFVDINHKGSTIMLVTHDPLVAAKANQVWFLLDGVIYRKEMLGPWDKSLESIINRKNKINSIMSEIGV